MKIKFIINPISGTGKQKGIEKDISKYFNNYQIEYTKQKGDATRISYDAVKNNFSKVIAIGGDGTVNECLKALINTNVVLAVIPCGSGNGFAYHIGMNSDTKKAIKQLQKTSIETIDLGSVNKIPFINVSGIGFDAHIAQLFDKSKRRGLANYVMLILKELNYQPQEYNIQYDGISRNITAYMISFANSSQYGNNIKMPNPLSDGLVEYNDGTEATEEQMAKDVVTFLAWSAEPHLEERHKIGFKVIIYLIILTFLAYFSMKRLWSRIEPKV